MSTPPTYSEMLTRARITSVRLEEMVSARRLLDEVRESLGVSEEDVPRVAVPVPPRPALTLIQGGRDAG